ncbi:MAG TPA: hypothetical protein DCY41_07995, partial [Opitutae bacterium]|nr:hypothetical protein [Opitutae bacterium]
MRIVSLFLALLSSNLIAGNEALAYQTVDALGGLTFNQPLGLAKIPGQKDRLLVLEKNGTVQLITGLEEKKPVKRIFFD